MKKILFSLLVLFSIHPLSQAQFNGKPLYDVLVRQYPDTFGTYRMELYPTIAPLHCENFDTLAQQGFYDSLAFHRVVPNFVIQGGDPNSKTGPTSTWGQGASWQQTVPAEFSPLAHNRSIIGAARAANINSATSQFYVNLANNSNLNGQYTAYGKVISGMNVVDSVEAVPRNANDLPLSKVDMFITYVGVDTSAPAMAPNLTAPADGAIDLFGDETFSWSAVNSNDFLLYRIEFSKQSDFSTIDYYENIAKNKTNVKPLSNLEQGFITYYWRVLTNNGGRMTASATRSFTTFIASPILKKPIDQATNTYINPIFEWYTVPGATQYNFVISTLPTLEIPNFNVIDTITWKRDFIPAPLNNNSTYYWGVRSIQNGVPGAFSVVRSFTTSTVISSINEEVEFSQGIYPNPNNGQFIVKMDKGLKGFVRITDLSGRVIIEKELNQEIEQFDISSEPDGVYIYRINSEGKFTSGKIIKN